MLRLVEMPTKAQQITKSEQDTGQNLHFGRENLGK